MPDLMSCIGKIQPRLFTAVIELLTVSIIVHKSCSILISYRRIIAHNYIAGQLNVIPAHSYLSRSIIGISRDYSVAIGIAHLPTCI